MQRKLVTLSYLCIAFCASTAWSSGIWVDPRERMEKATVVFGGMVESVREHDDYSTGTPVKRYEVVFKVGQVWKGPLEERFAVMCRMLECGWRYLVGERYLIYAYTSDRTDSPLYMDHTFDLPLLKYSYTDLVLLPDSHVVDPEIAVSRPTKEALTVLAEDADRKVQLSAADALRKYDVEYVGPKHSAR